MVSFKTMCYCFGSTFGNLGRASVLCLYKKRNMFFYFFPVCTVIPRSKCVCVCELIIDVWVGRWLGSLMRIHLFPASLFPITCRGVRLGKLEATRIVICVVTCRALRVPWILLLHTKSGIGACRLRLSRITFQRTTDLQLTVGIISQFTPMAKTCYSMTSSV